MKRTVRRSSFAALSALLCSAPALGQGLDVQTQDSRQRINAHDAASEAEVAAQAALEAAEAGGLVFAANTHLLGDWPVSLAQSYKALYSPDGVTFVPALGKQAPQTRLFEFRFECATVGGQAVGGLDLQAPPRLVDGQVHFDRGTLTEVYEARDEGLEQLF
ncbi:MAG: hypothetical protein AAFZ65_13565, partial [Planctomycetota bacterium]